jgi:hypothetical protein
MASLKVKYGPSNGIKVGQVDIIGSDPEFCSYGVLYSLGDNNDIVANAISADLSQTTTVNGVFASNLTEIEFGTLLAVAANSCGKKAIHEYHVYSDSYENFNTKLCLVYVTLSSGGLPYFSVVLSIMSVLFALFSY